MKEIKLNVPDEKASAFAEEFVKLCKKHGVGVDGINPAKDDRPVTERIKTFEDAYYALGDEHPLVREWNAIADVVRTAGGFSNELIAYLKIRIIAAALNGGRLCFKSEALAEYAGTQFLKEWSDLMMFTK